MTFFVAALPDTSYRFGTHLFAASGLTQGDAPGFSRKFNWRCIDLGLVGGASIKWEEG